MDLKYTLPLAQRRKKNGKFLKIKKNKLPRKLKKRLRKIRVCSPLVKKIDYEGIARALITVEEV